MDNPLNNVQIIHFKDLEEKYPSLKTAKSNRNRIEYFFTCSPAVCNYVIDQFDYIDSITYLDADLYFFSNPKKCSTADSKDRKGRNENKSGGSFNLTVLGID